MPLGSVTYYFSDLETLIVGAFETLREELEPRYAAPMRAARTSAEVVDALVAATCGRTAPTLDDIRLYEEMHLYGARSPRVAELVRDFQEESFVILRRSMSDGSARAADALMWGWWGYRAIHGDDALDEDTVRSAYRALLDLVAPEQVSPEEPRRD